jgi:anti-sigma regulatory factor (Ser/Thr protein kinase)
VTELVVSELVTNAVRHGCGTRRYWVTFMCVGAGLMIRVVDDSMKLPHIPDHSNELLEGGHGIELVLRLTVDFLVVKVPDGKAVSATVPFLDPQSADVILSDAARAA